MIIAIDPGPKHSAHLLWHPRPLVVQENAAITDNAELLTALRTARNKHFPLAIEMVESFGMAVGKEVFETVLWTGRFIEAWGGPFRLVYRKQVKMHLCGSMRAKDINIRQALIDKLGAPGTKKNKGPTYGIHSHLWSALAIAVTASETVTMEGKIVLSVPTAQPTTQA